MHFVVCIKQVPGTNDVRINPETHTLMTEGVESIINPLDMYAIEEALRLRDRVGGSVTALTMGPAQAETALREALAMGVNHAVLLSDSAFADSDTWATSYTLAKALEKIGDYSVILFGKQTSDGDTAQVGPSVAAFLDLPQITYVRKIEEIDAGRLVAERVLESGYERIESPLPCVLTVIKEINEPRLPSLKGKMAARKAEVVTWSGSDIAADPAMVGANGSPTRIIKLSPPQPRRGGEIIEGEPDEIARKLADKLRAIIIEAAS